MKLYIYLAAAIALTLLWSLIKGITRERKERAQHQSIDKRSELNLTKKL